MKTNRLNLLFSLILLILFNIQVKAVDIFVSPNGNDHNSGTIEAPLKTIAEAQRQLRNLRRINSTALAYGANIYLMDGKHKLIEPLHFRPEDSGTEACPTNILAAPNSHPVISGGVEIKNWKKAGTVKGFPKSTKGKLYVADIPKVGNQRLLFRQMWVNDQKANRASNLDDDKLNRILSVNSDEEYFWIPTPSYDINDINQLEFVIHQWWAVAILRVKTLKQQGDSTLITFHQPESRIEFEHPWPAPFIDAGDTLNGNSAFYLINHPALLNAQGEWYADYNTGKIYYWPREGEDMKQAEAVVPVLENLIQIEGTIDLPISNINFKNISFQHTTWLRPSFKGHVPLQAGFSCIDAYKLKNPGTPDKAGLENQAWLERQAAGITASYANHISLNNCQIKHMAATGIDFVIGTHHNTIERCTISDIGGTGIQFGFFGDEKFEAHLPYNPTDEREVCRFETIANNLITNCTNEDWGCVGIGIGFAHDINIEHNEVSHVNYSGICVGWGWTKTINCMKNNRVFANYIHHFAKNMYDVGGVYTLSAQPNSEIRDNRIEKLLKAPYAHIPKHYQYIYYDEGSSYIRSVNNWTEKDKFFSNTPGPGNEWISNGPQVADSIKNAAGIIPLKSK